MNGGSFSEISALSEAKRVHDGKIQLTSGAARRLTYGTAIWDGPASYGYTIPMAKPEEKWGRKPTFGKELLT